MTSEARLVKTESAPEAEGVYEEIATYFDGRVPAFFKAMGDTDPSLLAAKWADYKRTLFDGSTYLPKRLKYMMMYQVVKAHSQCHRCLDMHKTMMDDIGIDSQLVSDLERDISHSLLLDETSKAILVFTYHLASYHPTFNSWMDRPLNASIVLVGEKTTIEIVALIASCKSLQDFIHLLKLHR